MAKCQPYLTCSVVERIDVSFYFFIVFVIVAVPKHQQPRPEVEKLKGDLTVDAYWQRGGLSGLPWRTSMRNAFATHMLQHYRSKSTVTFLLVTQESPARLGTVHSSTCGPFPESKRMYTFPSPVALSLMAARERYVVFGFWRGSISDV